MLTKSESMSMVAKPNYDGELILINALRQALAEGVGHAKGAISPVLSKHIEEEGRFSYKPNDEPRRGNGAHRPIILEPRTQFEKNLLSARRKPAVRYMGQLFTGLAQAVGQSDDRYGLLQDWQSDRATVNFFRSRTKIGCVYPGQIYRHRDPPDFSGVIFALSCGQATATDYIETNGRISPRPIELDIGDVSVYAGADLAEELGIAQVEHSVSAELNQLSYTFVHHKKDLPPLGLSSIPERLQRP